MISYYPSIRRYYDRTDGRYVTANEVLTKLRADSSLRVTDISYQMDVTDTVLVKLVLEIAGREFNNPKVVELAKGLLPHLKLDIERPPNNAPKGPKEKRK